MKTVLAILLCVSVLTACDPDDHISRTDTGEWILYERGYSPGAGYITEDVPSSPAQTLLLKSDGSLETTITGWDKYKYYLTLEQGNDKNKVLALYEDKPLNPNPDINTLTVSYEMAIDENGNLRLYYRWCIEGCHLAFRKYNP